MTAPSTAATVGGRGEVVGVVENGGFISDSNIRGITVTNPSAVLALPHILRPSDPVTVVPAPAAIVPFPVLSSASADPVSGPAVASVNFSVAGFGSGSNTTAHVTMILTKSTHDQGANLSIG